VRDLVRQKVREEGRAEAKVEGSIVEREAVLGRARHPQRIVELALDVGDLEPKSRMAWGEVPLTPAHSFRDDVEALVATPLAQMGSECDRHSADSATDVEDRVVRCEPSERDEVTDEFPANLLEVTVADYAQARRGPQRIITTAPTSNRRSGAWKSLRNAGE
jgi:hypothetical protein